MDKGFEELDWTPVPGTLMVSCPLYVKGITFTATAVECVDVDGRPECELDDDQDYVDAIMDVHKEFMDPVYTDLFNDGRTFLVFIIPVE